MSCKRTARRPPPLERLTIDSLSFGGDAVGRDEDGRVVFVPGGAPGDRVEVAITEEKKGFARARLVRVFTPGAARIEPPCPLFLPAGAGCGGCQWQHVELGAQRAAKEDIVRRALRSVGATLDPIATPAPALRWRRRARLRWRGDHVGYVKQRSHELLDVEACPQLEAPLEEALRVLRGFTPPGSGELELLLGGRGDVHAVYSPFYLGGELAGRAKALLGRAGLAGIVLGDVTVGAARIDLGDDEQPFWARADVFAQATAAGNSLLRELVAGATPEGGRVLELHAGSGNFTRDLARRAAEVVAVEESPAAMALCADNLAERGLRATLLAQPAHVPPGPWDLVVVDPPRTGLDPELAAALAGVPAPLVYVSCDPNTLGRDLRLLGRRVTRAVPIDLMPQTYHVEVCVFLAPP